MDTEGRWGLPDIVVTVRKPGEESQIGVIRDALMVCSRAHLYVFVLELPISSLISVSPHASIEL